MDQVNWNHSTIFTHIIHRSIITVCVNIYWTNSRICLSYAGHKDGMKMSWPHCQFALSAWSTQAMLDISNAKRNWCAFNWLHGEINYSDHLILFHKFSTLNAKRGLLLWFETIFTMYSWYEIILVYNLSK